MPSAPRERSGIGSVCARRWSRLLGDPREDRLRVSQIRTWPSGSLSAGSFFSPVFCSRS
jgi:hypothetical protein